MTTTNKQTYLQARTTRLPGKQLDSKQQRPEGASVEPRHVHAQPSQSYKNCLCKHAMRSARERAAYLRQHTAAAADQRQTAEVSRTIASAEGRVSKGACAGVLRRKHTQCRAAAYLMQQQQQLLIAAQQRVEATPQAPAEQARQLSARAGLDLQKRLDCASMRARSISCAAAMRAAWRNSSSSSRVHAARQQQRNAQQSWGSVPGAAAG